MEPNLAENKPQKENKKEAQNCSVRLSLSMAQQHGSIGGLIGESLTKTTWRDPKNCYKPIGQSLKHAFA